MADFPAEHALLAAIDLGSNSFHLAIARLEHGQAKKISSFSEKVQLAAGLDENNHLSEAAQQRGLDCLSRFAGRLSGVQPCYLRIVATNALRQSKNAQEFIQRAAAILPTPIEVIAGREEARLIYLGVSHTIADDIGRRLVVDIGGGSTEFIIGEACVPLHTESMQMGCVTYSKRFFADGKITIEAFEQAALAAKTQLRAIVQAYQTTGWNHAIGSSGTIKACYHVMLALGLTDQQQQITKKSLQLLKQRLLLLNHVDQIDFKDLKADRRALLPAGLAILTAIFDVFNLEQMTYADGALREGVMYDLLARFRHQDIRDRSVEVLVSRYHIDARQAARVAETAQQLYDQAGISLTLNNDHADLIRRAAYLHELGLAISYSGYHRHGAYILQHSDIAGFSHNDQSRLAVLVGQHRRKLKVDQKENVMKLGGLPLLYDCLLLRLAVLMQRDRVDRALANIKLEIINSDLWQLSILDTTQSSLSLLADLQEEQQQFEHWGITLKALITSV